MATLKEKAQSILDEKIDKIVPENIKRGVTVFNVEGDYGKTYPTNTLYDGDSLVVKLNQHPEQFAHLMNEKFKKFLVDGYDYDYNYNISGVNLLPWLKDNTGYLTVDIVASGGASSVPFFIQVYPHEGYMSFDGYDLIVTYFTEDYVEWYKTYADNKGIPYNFDLFDESGWYRFDTAQDGVTIVGKGFGTSIASKLLYENITMSYMHTECSDYTSQEGDDLVNIPSSIYLDLFDTAVISDKFSTAIKPVVHISVENDLSDIVFAECVISVSQHHPSDNCASRREIYRGSNVKGSDIPSYEDGIAGGVGLLELYLSVSSGSTIIDAGDYKFYYYLSGDTVTYIELVKDMFKVD